MKIDHIVRSIVLKIQTLALVRDSMLQSGCNRSELWAVTCSVSPGLYLRYNVSVGSRLY